MDGTELRYAIKQINRSKQTMTRYEHEDAGIRHVITICKDNVIYTAQNVRSGKHITMQLLPTIPLYAIDNIHMSIDTTNTD